MHRTNLIFKGQKKPKTKQNKKKTCPKSDLLTSSMHYHIVITISWRGTSVYTWLDVWYTVYKVYQMWMKLHICYRQLSHLLLKDLNAYAQSMGGTSGVTCMQWICKGNIKYYENHTHTHRQKNRVALKCLQH